MTSENGWPKIFAGAGISRDALKAAEKNEAYAPAAPEPMVHPLHSSPRVKLWDPAQYAKLTYFEREMAILMDTERLLLDSQGAASLTPDDAAKIIELLDKTHRRMGVVVEHMAVEAKYGDE